MRAFFDLLALVALMGAVLHYAMRGDLSPETTGILLVLLVALLATGHSLRVGVISLLVRICVSLGSAGALLFHYSGSDLSSIRQCASSFLTLAIMLLGLYVMFRAVLPRRRRNCRELRPTVRQGIELHYRRGWWW